MTGRLSPDPGRIWRKGQVEARPSKGWADGARRLRRGSRRGRWFAVAGYAGLALVCLGLAAVAFVVVAAPVDAVRDRLIEQVAARTGRTLTVAGPASVSLFPRVVVTLSDVALPPPAGMEGGAALSVGAVEIEVSLWSLLSRRPQLGAVTLHRPTIELTIDAQGRRSWEFANLQPAPSGPVDASGGGLQRPDKPAPAARREKRLEWLGSVRVVDATLRYRDERSATQLEVGALNLVLTATGLEGGVAVDGTLMWRGVEVVLSATASPLRSVLAEQEAQLVLKVSAAPLQAVYQGTLAFAGGVSANGKIDIKAASAQALRDWLGTAWPLGSAADALTISGHLTARAGEVTLASLEASSGGVQLAGSLAVHLTSRTSVSGKLRISELDLSRAPPAGAKRADATPPPLPSGPAAAPEPDKRAARKAWSDAAFDPQILTLADADLALSVGRIVYGSVKTGESKLTVSVKDGLATVVLEDAELYGGRAHGRLVLDGTGGTLAADTSLNLAGVTLLPLLSDAAGVAWLDGRGTITLAVKGQGLSEAQIVESLSGKLGVDVTEGALTGIDVGKVLRALERGRLPNLAPAQRDRTPFSELAGTFDITNGTARNRDLKLVGPHLQLKGEGVIELGPRRIDYTLRAKIEGGQPAEGATVRIGTLEVPIGIKGPLDAPEFAIKGYEELSGTLKQIGKNLRSREVQDAIKGLLSGDRDKRVKPQELIDKLLKKE